MSNEREGFLSRWSRRKAELQHEEATPPTEPRPAVGAEPTLEASEALPEGGELTPEEIEALPRVEDLTPETDITVFLRKGVPEALKNAALRRMWTLDPAIRDYRSEALDYAYDWNVPGGVPGNGPMLPTDDIAAMVRQVFGDPPPESPEVAEGTARGPMSQSVEPAAGEGGERPPEPAESAASETLGQSGNLPVDMAVPLAEQSVRLSAQERLEAAPDWDQTPESEPITGPIVPRRRHGGAKPV
jgi:hypothetical protein